MGATTNIEWTDSTWNPLRGCSRVSEGCRNCYAEKVAYRFSGPGQAYEGLAVLRNGHASWTGQVDFAENHLLDPLKWKQVRTAPARPANGELFRPRRIFVNSMSDLFHENVRDEWIDKIFAVMALCPQHVFQVLTKRPERMNAYLSEPGRRSAILLQVSELCWELETHSDLPNVPSHVELQDLVYRLKSNVWPLPNVWLGVSVENQKAADERIPLLLQTPAAVRFLSCEPLLGSLRLFLYLGDDIDPSDDNREYRGIDWVIAGGESGTGARPMHPDWVRSLRDQCLHAGTAFFFKQWGEWQPIYYADQSGQPMLKISVPNETNFKPSHKEIVFTLTDSPGKPSVNMTRVGKKAAGAQLEDKTWRQFPEVQHAQQ